jgi:hypothetical protein
MGEVIKLSRIDPEKVTGIEVAGNGQFAILLDRDLETNEWSWRAYTRIKFGPFEGVGLLLVVQQDPQVTYPTMIEAQHSALEVTWNLELPQHVLR